MSHFDAMNAGQVGAGYPSASPQPGLSQPWPEYPQGANSPLMSPPQPANLSRWQDLALSGALGIQLAMTNPYVRRAIGDLIDKAMRVSWKPTALPPWQEKPFRGQYYGGVEEVSLPDAVDFETLVTYEIPEGDMAVIREFGIGLKDAADVSNFHVRVLVNGDPVAPLQDVTCLIGTPAQPHFFSIIVQGGGKIEIQGYAEGGSAIDTSIWLLGWRWPAPAAGSQDHGDTMSTVGG